MQLIRMTEYDKKKMDAEAAAEAHGRLYSGATRTVAPPSAKLSPAEAREAVLKAVSVQEKKRFEWFARVYPPLEFEEVSTVCVCVYSLAFVRFYCIWVTARLSSACFDTVFDVACLFPPVPPSVPVPPIPDESVA